MAKHHKDKLAALKAIANGTQTFDIMRPPKSYVINKHIETGVSMYEYNGKEMNEDQYQEWYKDNIREDLDTILHFIEIVVYSEDELPARNSRTLEIHQEPIVA